MHITEYLEERYKKHLSVLNKFDMVVNESLWKESKFLTSVSEEIKSLRMFFDQTLCMRIL